MANSKEEGEEEEEEVKTDSKEDITEEEIPGWEEEGKEDQEFKAVPNSRTEVVIAIKCKGPVLTLLPLCLPRGLLH